MTGVWPKCWIVEFGIDEPPPKRHRSMSRKTDHSDDSDSTQNFHRDDPQIGVCLQYLRFIIIAYVSISTRLITPPPPPSPPPSSVQFGYLQDHDLVFKIVKQISMHSQ